MRQVALGGALVRVADAKPTFWDRVEAGTWEPGTLAALAPSLGPGTLFVDIGAWVGPLSLLAAARGARVVALEADPAAQREFRRNLAVNPDLADRIELIEAAISPTAGSVRLGARRKPGDSMSSVLLAEESDTAWTAPAITPSDLAARLGEADRVVVKMDIEGGEYAVLPHLRPLLGCPDTVVLLSLHPVILSEAGREDIAAATERALAPLNGWRARSVDAGANERGIAPDVLVGNVKRETWLLASPGSSETRRTTA